MTTTAPADSAPRLRSVWRGRKYQGVGWDGSLKPFHTETGVRVTTHQAGEGVAHRLHDGRTKIGHISGFVQGSPGEERLHVHVTTLSSETHRGQGHWQSAVQALAKHYPGGVHFHTFDTSAAAKKAIRKIPGVIETPDDFTVKHSHVSEAFLGYKLSSASREKLLRAIPPLYGKVIADHITTDFIGDRQTSFLPPAPHRVEVIGHAHDPEKGIHAAVIRVDGREHQGMDPERRLHVTISHGEKAKPVHASAAIKKGWERFEHPIPLDVKPFLGESVHTLTDMLINGASAFSLLGESHDPVAQLHQYDDVLRDVSRHIGQKAYLVGGAVRDAHLGRPNKDVDLTTIGGREKLEKLGYTPIKGDFPVYTHRNFPGVEVALARGEKKTGTGHTGFAWHEADDLATDLTRRDLTANAMAYHPDDGVIDPHGGTRDLQLGVLKHVGPHFAEDPLRTFRTARFAAQLGLRVHPSTIETMRSTGPELASLPHRRVHEEMQKALRAPNPRAYFDTLHQAGVLSHWHPEVAALKGKPSSLPHSGDAYEHTMDALGEASKAKAGDDVSHLLLTQQMSPEHLQSHVNRFGLSQQTARKLTTHAAYHATPFEEKKSREHTVKYWQRISASNARPEHGVATTMNQHVSQVVPPSDYAPDFGKLDKVNSEFTPDDFKKLGKGEVQPFKMRRFTGVLESISQLVDMLIEGSDVDLYHVTHTRHAPSIKKKGLTRMNTSNWVKAGDKSRYGSGEVYAFTHQVDAHRWAAKMDWEFNKEIGSGKVSIVHFKGDRDHWEKDESDAPSQAMHKGEWLKSQRPVAADRIHKIYPLGNEHLAALRL